MKDRYVVLTIVRPSGFESLSANPTSVAEAQAKCDILELTDAQVRAATNATTSFVRAGLPLSLIEPMDDPAPASVTLAASPQWGLDAVAALCSSRTGKGVSVAVLDTGCDLDHPAFARLKAEKRITCRNFTTDGAETDVTDRHVRQGSLRS